MKLRFLILFFLFIVTPAGLFPQASEENPAEQSVDTPQQAVPAQPQTDDTTSPAAVQESQPALQPQAPAQIQAPQPAVQSQPAVAPATQAGSIQGFIPVEYRYARVSLADLQTVEGQEWYDELQALDELEDHTDFVCRNTTPVATIPGPDRAFYFYQIPAGSYVIAACIQRPDGSWQAGVSVIQVYSGQRSVVALGLESGPVAYNYNTYFPNYYVVFYEPAWYDDCYNCNWRGSVSYYYYVPPPRRRTAIWINVGPVFPGFPVPIPAEVRISTYHNHRGHHHHPNRSSHSDVDSVEITPPVPPIPSVKMHKTPLGPIPVPSIKQRGKAPTIHFHKHGSRHRGFRF